MAKMRLAVVLAFAASPTAAWSPISSGLFVRRSTTLWAKIGTIFGTSSGSTEVRAVPRLVIKNIFASESSCSSEIYCLIFEHLHVYASGCCRYDRRSFWWRCRGAREHRWCANASVSRTSWAQNINSKEIPLLHFVNIISTWFNKN